MFKTILRLNKILELTEEVFDMQNDQILFNNFIKEIREYKNFNYYMKMMSEIKEDYLYKSIKHGIMHNERVSLFALYIALKQELDLIDLIILIEAAKYHDIGRENDFRDDYHGLRSANMIASITNEKLKQNDLNILASIVECHSYNDEYLIDENKIKIILNKYNIDEKKRFIKLARILKDADGLDRVRLSGEKSKLDENYLRTKEAKKLVKVAYKLFENYQKI